MAYMYENIDVALHHLRKAGLSDVWLGRYTPLPYEYEVGLFDGDDEFPGIDDRGYKNLLTEMNFSSRGSGQGVWYTGDPVVINLYDPGHTKNLGNVILLLANPKEDGGEDLISRGKYGVVVYSSVLVPNPKWDDPLGYEDRARHLNVEHLLHHLASDVLTAYKNAIEASDLHDETFALEDSL